MSKQSLSDKFVQLDSRVRYRAVGDEGVLVHLDSGRVIVINEVGLHLVQLLERPVTPEALTQSVAQSFAVSPDQARADIATYLEAMAAEQLLNTEH